MIEIANFLLDAKKKAARFTFPKDSIEQVLTDYTELPGHPHKQLVNPETIVEQQMQLVVLGFGNYNSILHYILKDRKDNFHLFTWNEFRQLRNCYAADAVSVV